MASLKNRPLPPLGEINHVTHWIALNPGSFDCFVTTLTELSRRIGSRSRKCIWWNLAVFSTRRTSIIGWVQRGWNACYMPDGVLNIERGRLDLSLLAHGLQKHECVSTASCKLDNRYYGIRLMVQHTKLAIRYNHEAALSLSALGNQKTNHRVSVRRQGALLFVTREQNKAGWGGRCKTRPFFFFLTYCLWNELYLTL